MGLFYTWHKNTSEDALKDIENWKQNKFTYTYQGVESKKAFWVFESGSDYKPTKNITKKRILVVFDFGTHGDGVIKNTENRVYSEDQDFAGETGHPSQVIWKNNEVGAYGIGRFVRHWVSVKSIRLGTLKEMAAALGLSTMEIDTTNQKW